METSVPRIVAADRVDGSVIITFSNGKIVLYPATLLHAIIHQAEEVLEPEPEED